jgi:hypothetical protein
MRAEPESVAGGLNPDGDGWRQGSIEPLDGITRMGKHLIPHFPRVRIENGDVLLARVQLASHQCHECGLPSRRVVVARGGRAYQQGPFS